MLIWIQFAAAAALVVGAGWKLAAQAEELAEAKGLTRLWLGFIFLAAATSIPELATAVGAVFLAGSPALALGDLLGSNSFNIFIIAILGAVLGGRSVLQGVGLKSFRMLLSFGALMTAIVLGAIMAHRAGWNGALGRVGWGSLLLLACYLVSSTLIFRDEKRYAAKRTKNAPTRALGTGFYLRLGLAVIVVAAAGCWLSKVSGDIAQITGWGATFVGALFLAVVTSLPELAVSAGAIKVGSPHMALGNIFGSNIFNLGIIFLVDLAWSGGPILARADGGAIGAGILALILTATAALALKTKSVKTGAAGPARYWDTAAIAAVYLGGMYLIFSLSRGH